MWRAFICRTMTGELLEELDMPSFSWSVTMGGSSLETKRDFSYGEDDVGGIQLPWSAVRGATKQEAARALATGRRAIAIGWEESGVWRPVVFGAIGDRTDSWDGTSFELQSVWDMLECRYLCNTSRYKDGGDVWYSKSWLQMLQSPAMSKRGLCSYAGRHVTDAGAPDGRGLPIVWTYYAEEGDRVLDLSVGNLSSATFAKLAEDLMNRESEAESLYRDGKYVPCPDATFLPECTDGTVRLRFLCGTESEPLISPGQGCTLEDFGGAEVQHAQPYGRVYLKGDEIEDEEDEEDTDEDTEEEEAYEALWAANPSLWEGDDPFPLRETVMEVSDYADTALEEYGISNSLYLLTVARAAATTSESIPLAQLTLEVHASQLPLGLTWPGDYCDVVMEDDFPSLPDGTYHLRIMELQGDSTDRVTVTFYPFEDPMYAL